MNEWLLNLVYLAHPVGYALIFISSILMYLSGYKFPASIIAIASFSVVFTTIMSWVTHNPTPIEHTEPDGTYSIHFGQSIWEQIQYPLYTYATLLLAIGMVLFAVQLFNQRAR